ncbi:hypothetical protein NY78_2742 [Desulfovibrio sp. TomC]|nr:hypothetical protein NY78_2742 [Desulfovibrio sp. TomC]
MDGAKPVPIRASPDSRTVVFPCQGRRLFQVRNRPTCRTAPKNP